MSRSRPSGRRVRDQRLFIGVPVKLGKGGIGEIIQIKLTAEEEAELKKSAAAVQELIDTMKKMA